MHPRRAPLGAQGASKWFPKTILEVLGSPFGGIWIPLGGIWAPWGASWVPFWRYLGHFGRYLDPLGWYLGSCLEVFRSVPCMCIPNPKLGLKSVGCYSTTLLAGICMIPPYVFIKVEPNIPAANRTGAIHGTQDVEKIRDLWTPVWGTVAGRPEATGYIYIYIYIQAHFWNFHFF